MKMSKTIKKLNDRLNLVLEKVEGIANEELQGFDHLEHTIQFDLFPGSLHVSCFFKTHDDLDKAKSSEKAYQKKLHNLLMKQGVLLKEPKQNLKFYVKKAEA